MINNYNNSMKNIGSIKIWIQIILILILYVFFTSFLQFIVLLVMGINLTTDTFSQISLFQELIITIISSIITIFFVWTCSFDDKKDLLDIVVSPFKVILKDVFGGIFLGVLLISIGFIVLLFLHQISVKEVNWVFSGFFLSFLLFVFVAITEEILFRGFLLNRLMKSVHVTVALIGSSLLFTAMHVMNENCTSIGLFNIFMAGIILGLLFIITKKIWLPIAFHFSWNFFQAMCGFGVSGHNSYSLIEQEKENNSINGGLFGFEGSFVCSILMLLTTVVFVLLYWEKIKQPFSNFDNK